jgi:hypothetical protein
MTFDEELLKLKTPEDYAAKTATWSCAQCCDHGTSDTTVCRDCLKDNIATAIKSAVAKAVAIEREACAELCDDLAHHIENHSELKLTATPWRHLIQAAKDIRARHAS